MYSVSCKILMMRTIVILAFCLVLLAVAVNQIEAKIDAEQCFPWVCDRPAKHGPCKKFNLRYYYEPATDSCHMFTYGGCFGNLNNYKTFEECMWMCFRRINPPYMCLQYMDAGSADCYYPYDQGEKWYFDMDASECKKFTYQGCGGNTNRFDTKFECVSSCKPRR